MTANASAIILSGGKSSRMGEEDKPLLPFGEGETIIRFIIKKLQGLFWEIILVTRSPQKYDDCGARVVKDIYQAGPLGGLHAGLYYSRSPFAFVMACDMPFINLQLVEYMIERKKRETDILIPEINRKLEPLHALYHRDCLPIIEKAIEEKSFKIISFFPYVDVEYLPCTIMKEIDRDLHSFFNINTREDYREALKMRRCGLL